MYATAIAGLAVQCPVVDGHANSLGDPEARYRRLVVHHPSYLLLFLARNLSRLHFSSLSPRTSTQIYTQGHLTITLRSLTLLEITKKCIGDEPRAARICCRVRRRASSEAVAAARGCTYSGGSDTIRAPCAAASRSCCCVPCFHERGIGLVVGAGGFLFVKDFRGLISG